MTEWGMGNGQLTIGNKQLAMDNASTSLSDRWELAIKPSQASKQFNSPTIPQIKNQKSKNQPIFAPQNFD